MSCIAPADLAERPFAVLGAGALGRRIALRLASHGAEVRIYDLSAEQCQATVGYVMAGLPKLLAKDASYSAGHAVGVDDLATAVADTWLISEAIPECLDLKRTIFGQLDRLAPADAILASNSSSYPTSAFIDEVSAAGRARVVNTHFYMPPVQNAVEVMSCGHTEPAVIDTLLRTRATYGGSVPFQVLQERVGFIFNRVWAAIKREVLAVVAAGVSTPEDVGRIYRVNIGRGGRTFLLNGPGRAGRGAPYRRTLRCPQPGAAHGPARIAGPVDQPALAGGEKRVRLLQRLRSQQLACRLLFH